MLRLALCRRLVHQSRTDSFRNLWHAEGFWCAVCAARTREWKGPLNAMSKGFHLARWARRRCRGRLGFLLPHGSVRVLAALEVRGGRDGGNCRLGTVLSFHHFWTVSWRLGIASGPMVEFPRLGLAHLGLFKFTVTAADATTAQWLLLLLQLERLQLLLLLLLLLLPHSCLLWVSILSL